MNITKLRKIVFTNDIFEIFKTADVSIFFIIMIRNNSKWTSLTQINTFTNTPGETDGNRILLQYITITNATLLFFFLQTENVNLNL
jgi:hypothetical protein